MKAIGDVAVKAFGKIKAWFPQRLFDSLSLSQSKEHKRL